METVWCFSGTVAYRNNTVAEIMVINDGGGRRLVGTQKAFTDIAKNNFLRRLFNKPTVNVDPTIRDSSFKLQYTAVGSFGFKYIDNYQIENYENSDFVRTSYEFDPHLQRFMRAIMDNATTNNRIITGDYADNLPSQSPNAYYDKSFYGSAFDRTSGTIIFTSWNDSTIVRSGDRGKTFQTLSGPAGYKGLLDVCYVGDGVFLGASRGEATAKVIRSVDFGKTWQNIGEITGGQSRAIGRVGNGIAIAGIGDFKLYRTTNYGDTWDLVLDRSADNDRCYEIEHIGNGVVLAFSFYDCKIYRSLDYGLTWSFVAQMDTFQSLFSICNLGNGIILGSAESAGNRTGGFIKSEDWGASWRYINRSNYDFSWSQSDPILQIGSACYLQDGIVLSGLSAGGEDITHYIKSNDFGETWKDVGIIPSVISRQFTQDVFDIGGGVIVYSTITNSNSSIFVTPEFDLFSQYACA